MIPRNYRVDIPHQGSYWQRPRAGKALLWLGEQGAEPFRDYETDLRDDCTAFYFKDQGLAAQFKMLFG